MYREHFLRRGILSVGLLLCAYLWNAGVARCQSTEAPLLPMNVEFRYVPQYLGESISDDPLYSRIEALLDEKGCDVILLEKSTNREALYSNSKRRVDAQSANGRDAYLTPIGCTLFRANDPNSGFVIHLQDRFRNEILWKFTIGEIIPHASPEVIFLTDDTGMSFLYAPRRAPSADGTILKIANREYLPEATQSDDVLTAFYAADMTRGQILPGTDLWTVEHTPADIVQTAKWSVGGDGGRVRTLAVEHFSATEASIEQSDLNDPDGPRIILNVVRVNDTYEFRSVSFVRHLNTLWIFFGPQLPFPAHEVNDRRIVTFTIAENEQANIASGELEVLRVVDAERVLWHFEMPDVARGITFETGVNVIPNGRQGLSGQSP